jgi:hypothetical protein
MDKNLVLAYLDGRRLPIGEVSKAAELHRALFAQAPEFYLDMLVDRSAHVSQRREVLANLTRHPHAVRADRKAILARLRAQPVEERFRSWKP